MNVKTAQGISRRALLAAITVSPAVLCSRLFAQVVNDGSCAKVIPGRLPTPWFVTFDPLFHPLVSGKPSIRPGQQLRGKWSFYTWACGANKIFVGTPDLARPGWTLELDFENHSLISPVPVGNFLGVPDQATQADFYRIGAVPTRILTMMVKNQAGQFVPKPNETLVAFPGHTTQTDSGSTSIFLVPDDSTSVVFDDTTPADGKTLSWKTDTFTVGIVGHVSPTVPGAPYSAMTATGNINFTDLSSSPLLPQTTAYSISIPPGGIGTIGAAATGAQNFQWPWFDHAPFGGITGLTSRTVRYDVVGNIADTFGNQYPVAAGSRTYQINVSNVKISFVLASISAYTSAAVFGAASVIYGLFSAIAGALEQPELSALFGLGGTVTSGVAAYFTAIAVGDQANAADPPAPDPNFTAVVEFSQDSVPALPNPKGMENFQVFAKACSLLTLIYPAITTTQGRIWGAHVAKDGKNLNMQQRHLQQLMQLAADTSGKMASSVQPAIHEFETLLAHIKHPITKAQLGEELARWSKEGIPGRVSEAFRQAGLDQEAVTIIGRRLADPALRQKALDVSSTLKSLSANLIKAADGMKPEAKSFLAMTL